MVFPCYLGGCGGLHTVGAGELSCSRFRLQRGYMRSDGAQWEVTEVTGDAGPFKRS